MAWLELIFRWILGLQLVFWGLNGFFHWKSIPPSTDFINRFSEICVQSRFIMPTVKVFEILFGFLLLTGTHTSLALIALGPIIFVVTGLHAVHNPQRSWEVVLPISLPFVGVLLLNFESWRGLF